MDQTRPAANAGSSPGKKAMAGQGRGSQGRLKRRKEVEKKAEWIRGKAKGAKTAFGPDQTGGECRKLPRKKSNGCTGPRQSGEVKKKERGGEKG